MRFVEAFNVEWYESIKSEDGVGTSLFSPDSDKPRAHTEKALPRMYPNLTVYEIDAGV